MSNHYKHFYEFGSFRLDVGERLLLCDDKPVPLQPKAFDILLVLVRNSNHLVGKDELMQAIWPDAFVEEGNLTLNVSLLRKALGERKNSHTPRYIETVSKRGYRFVASVREVRSEEAHPIEENPNGSHTIADESETINSKNRTADELNTAQVTAKVDSAIKREPKEQRRRLLIGIALVAGLTLAASLFWIPKRTKDTPAGNLTARSLAVLPFKSLDAEHSDDYLGVGMTDTLITKLSNVRQLVVRPTSAVLKYTGQQDTLAAGRELEVSAVLEGSIQRVNERMRVTVRLINVRDGATVWAEKFDENLTDVLAMQDAISEQVAVALVTRLTGDERKQLTKRHTANIEAYQLYLKGAFYLHKGSPEAWKQSIEYFKQAIEKDSHYALPYAGLSVSYNLLCGFGVLMPQEGMSKAKEAALKALEIDDTLGDSHLALALVLWGYDWNWPEAEKEFKRAIELSPSYSPTHNTYAHFLMSMGRIEEALAESRLALELNPNDSYMIEDLAWHYLIARQYDQAIEQCRRALERDSSAYGPHLYLGWAYEQRGMYQEAITELQRARELATDSPHTLAALGHAYAASGNRIEAQRILDELKKPSKQNYVSPYFAAIIYAGLGENDQALENLQKAYEHRMAELVLLKMEPRFDGLRSDPRFQDLLRRVKLIL